MIKKLLTLILMIALPVSLLATVPGLYGKHGVKYIESETSKLVDKSFWGAYYPGYDMIALHTDSYYHSLDQKFKVCLHELIHWTRSNKRLGEAGTYNVEEVVAESGAYMLCLELGYSSQDLNWIRTYVAGYAGKKGVTKHDYLFICRCIKESADYLTGSDHDLKDIQDFMRNVVQLKVQNR